MSEMVDQVALALWKLEFHEGRAPIPIPAEDVKIFRERARAAIEAMRAPTPKMLKACNSIMGGGFQNSHSDLETWETMIDEALK